MQGFNFRKLKPPQQSDSAPTQLTGNYGLLQTEGGPCGIIAAVQAHICYFLFHTEKEREKVFLSKTNTDRKKKAAPLHHAAIESGEEGIEKEVDERDKTVVMPLLSEEDQTRLLTLALARILWRCALARSGAGVGGSASGGGKGGAGAGGKGAGGGRAGAGSGEATTTTTAHVLMLRTQCDINAGFPTSGSVIDMAVEDEDNLCRLLYSSLTTAATTGAGAKIGFKSAWGCVLLLLSALVCRGIDDVQGDMDFPIPLVDEHWYCTQEMANLLVVGKAIGNVVDDDDNSRVLASASSPLSTSLKGIPFRADVGQLSIYEVNGLIMMGRRLKYPLTPIWLINFESHYCVLFSPDRLKVVDELYTGNVKKAWRKKLFDIYFFDQQGKNVEEIRLTVVFPFVASMNKTSPSSSSSSSSPKSGLVPPLEKLLSTCFPNSTYDWNGVEPFL